MAHVAHRWRFFRAGGFDQVRIDRPDDLSALPDLDLKLWVALSCPTRGVEFDARTLQLLDKDGDGRIRAPDVNAAIRWTSARLRDPKILLDAQPQLRLTDIETAATDGAEILESAKQLLARLGRPDADSITIADTTDIQRTFAGTVFNGDGVITVDAAEADPVLRAVLEEIMRTFGTLKDASGKDGVDQDRVDAFWKAVNARAEWLHAVPTDPSLPGELLRAEASLTYAAVRNKVDDFFTRCSLAAMDPRAGVFLDTPAEEYVRLGHGVLRTSNDEVAALPLAKVSEQARLPFTAGLNPAWKDRVLAFRDRIARPLVGADHELDLESWRRIERAMSAHDAWMAKRPTGPLDALSDARIRELADPAMKRAIDGLMAKEKSLETAVTKIGDVDRLVHFARYLHAFVDQLVSFRDFYERTGKGMFQAGTLYLDGRSMDLCIRVDDIGQHAVLAVHSMMYLAYCECVRRGAPEKQRQDPPIEKMIIVAAFTDGDADFLMVGRNGIFFDRQGRDWHATVTRIVAQPIGLRQAFFAPYKRVARLVTEQVEKFAGAKDATGKDPLGTAVAQTASGAAPFDAAKFAGIFAAVGLALGTIGSAIAATVGGFLGLRPWQMPIAIIAALMVVSGPSIVLAQMKLRRRNLGPLLDASGWAINARARISVRFGKTLTQLRDLPKGSSVSRRDPYAHGRRWPWLLVAIAAGLASWWAIRTGQFGKLRGAMSSAAAKHAK